MRVALYWIGIGLLLIIAVHAPKAMSANARLDGVYSAAVASAPHWQFVSPEGGEQWWRSNRNWAGTLLLVVILLLVIFPRVLGFVICGSLLGATIVTGNLFFVMVAAIIAASVYVIEDVKAEFLSDPREGRSKLSPESILEAASRAATSNSVVVIGKPGHEWTSARARSTRALPDELQTIDRRSHYGKSVTVQSGAMPQRASTDTDLLAGVPIFVDYDYSSDACQQAARALRAVLSSSRAALKASENGAVFCLWIQPSNQHHVGVEILKSSDRNRTVFCDCLANEVTAIVLDALAAM